MNAGQGIAMRVCSYLEPDSLVRSRSVGGVQGGLWGFVCTDPFASILVRCPCRPHADNASSKSLAQCLAEEEAVAKVAERGELPFLA